MSIAMGWPTHWMTQTGEGKFSCWKRMQASHDFMNKIYWSTILYFTLTRLWTTHSEWGLFLAAQKSSPCSYSYVCMKPIENVPCYCRVQFSIMLTLTLVFQLFHSQIECQHPNTRFCDCHTLHGQPSVIETMQHPADLDLHSAPGGHITGVQLSGTVQCDCFAAHFSTVGYCPVWLLHSSLLFRMLSACSGTCLCLSTVWH